MRKAPITELFLFAYLRDFTEQNNCYLFCPESNLIIFASYQNNKL